jgi:hypothetical protein
MKDVNELIDELLVLREKERTLYENITDLGFMLTESKSYDDYYDIFVKVYTRRGYRLVSRAPYPVAGCKNFKDEWLIPLDDDSLTDELYEEKEKN